MIERCGKIIAVSDRDCVVRMRDERCDDCPGHCSIGFSSHRDLTVAAAGVSLGDDVRVAVHERGLNLAAAAVFLLPLAAAMVGGLSAGSQELGVSVGLLLGMVITFVIAKHDRFRRMLVPRLVD